VHEAFVKLVPVERVDWRSRAHFFAIASRAMRNVLARPRGTQGCGQTWGGAQALTLNEADGSLEQPPMS
jgi:hypothetical protein